MTKARIKKWFANCGGYYPDHSVQKLRSGLEEGLLDQPDEYGMSALHYAASSGWKEGVDELIRAGANTELRHHRTGTTALYEAVLRKDKPIILALLGAGANPDAANYWGITPRLVAVRSGFDSWFEGIPSREAKLPDPWIQNTEHLADHYHPRFKIPGRAERETLQPGQAVDLYVYGPKAEKKQDTIKVRISETHGSGPMVRYLAVVETPLEQTHLLAGTTQLEFGPENVATVYVERGKSTRKGRKPS